MSCAFDSSVMVYGRLTGEPVTRGRGRTKIEGVWDFGRLPGGKEDADFVSRIALTEK